MEKSNITKNKKVFPEFYEPIKTKKISFFLRKNDTDYSRFIIIIPKPLLKLSHRRNSMRRIIKDSFFKCNLSKLNVDVIIKIKFIPANKDFFIYNLDNIWVKLSQI